MSLAIVYFSADRSQVHVKMCYLIFNKNFNTDCTCACFYFLQVTGFLEKNRDGLKPDLEDLISSCGSKVCMCS